MKTEKSKLETRNEQLDIPVVIQRDIYQELRVVGLTHDQCRDVMDLIDTLPIHIKDGINNTKVSVSNGIITVEPNHVVCSSVSLPKQKRVMFKFDDDEPMQLNSIFEGGEFIIKLKEGKIKFEKGGKSFELYVE